MHGDLAHCLYIKSFKSTYNPANLPQCLPHIFYKCEVKMSLLKFKKEDIARIKSGARNSCIQSLPTHSISEGDHLQMYSGAFSKTKRIGKAMCTKVVPILIHWKNVYVNKKKLSTKQIAMLARSEGFANANAFLDFYNRECSHLFLGVILHWKIIIVPTRRRKTNVHTIHNIIGYFVRGIRWIFNTQATT